MVRQTSPEGLLDTYHAERHPVAVRVLRNTMANGPQRDFTLLHNARPVLLNLGEPGGIDVTP